MASKIRVMPTLLFKNVGLVKGISFDSSRRVGSAMQAVKVYGMREVDELVFLDVAATAEGRGPDYETIDELADECFMPFSVGGGIRSVKQVQRLLRVGADKVIINTAAVEVPGLVRSVADEFGSQCVVVSIDVRCLGGRREVYTRSGTFGTGIDPVEFASAAEAEGAGEVLLTSVERDGTMTGYDLELMRAVANAVRIPVIASGGAGRYEDLAEVLHTTKVAAVAAASMFHFTEQTPLGAKVYLRERGFAVRI